MGQLARFRFSGEFITRFPEFVETGTGRGVSLRYAAEHGFRRLASIDIDQRLTDAAEAMFADDDGVFVFCGQSPKVLDNLKLLPGTLFWLDAHSPGADFFGEDYAAEPDRRVRLPLQEELETIARKIPSGDYCIIIDDRRIYEDGDYQHGNIPPGLHNLRGADRHLRFVDELFGESHDIVRFDQDAGYVVITPRDAPRPYLIPAYTLEDQVGIARRHVECNDLFSARVEYQRVLEMTQPLEGPNMSLRRVSRGEACRFMAMFSQTEHHEGTAIDWFLEAAAADPLAIEHRIDLIFQSLIPRADLKIARDEGEKALRIAAAYLTKDETARAWRALAEVERQSGDAAKMLVAVEGAEACDPLHVDTWRVRAMYHADVGELDTASDIYRQLIAQPGVENAQIQGYLGLSICQSRAGDHLGAIESLDRAISLGCDDPMAHWRRSDELLAIGRYAEGWADQQRRFELERRMPGVGPAGRRFQRPLFDPASKPQRVHVHAEQGFGDVIAMSRYIQLLVDMGHQVQFEVSAPLVQLMTDSFEHLGVRVVPMAFDYPGALGLEDFDSHVPIMSFPALFGTSIDTIPWRGPYLFANASIYNRMNQGLPRGQRIGLCWQSAQQPGLWHAEYSRRKSVPFRALGPLRAAANEGIFVPLQLDGWPENQLIFRADWVSLNVNSTWADTAALIDCLDIVIACDTAVAHLAGAMGKPVWVMMHTPGASWHWMEDRVDSPWYPTARLFRQPAPHQWTDVVETIAAALG